MADSDYFGGPRHAPAPQITPMSQDQVGGTSAILNAAGRSRPRKGAVGRVGAPSGIASPLSLEGSADILKSAKLGQYASKSTDSGETQNTDQSFNRDPARPPTTGNPGDPDNPHPLMSRMRDALSIRGAESSPVPNRTLGDYNYPNLDYMPEMQQRMGMSPDFFGGDQ